MPEPEETATCLSPATVPATRSDNSGSPSSSLSSYMIPTSSTNINTIFETFQIIQSNCYHQQGVIKGTAVVDSDMEWQHIHQPYLGQNTTISARLTTSSPCQHRWSFQYLPSYRSQPLLGHSRRPHHPREWSYCY